MASEIKKILLIDSNQDVARIMQKDLVEASNKVFEVELADCLSTGLGRIKRGGIEVILLDLSLSDSTGLDTFARVHDSAPEVPIIVLTNFDDNAIARKVMQNGAQDYLLKGSVDGDMLTHAIVYAIERHQRLRGLQLAHQRKPRLLAGFWRKLNPFSNVYNELKVIHSNEKFYALIERARSLSDRHNQSFSLVTFEVKNGGTSEVPSEYLIGLLFKRRLRPSDEVGWFDKRNIGILLHNTNTAGARKYSNIIREAIAAKHNPPECNVYTYPSESLDALEGVSLKRSNERHGIKAKATVYIEECEGGEEEKLDLLTSNFSTGGAFLETKRSLPIGTAININVIFHLDDLRKLEGENVQIKVSGKVVRVEEKGIAIRFDKDYEIKPLKEEKRER